MIDRRTGHGKQPSPHAPAGGHIVGRPGDGHTISAVLHKAYVDLNEEGTEATAATGVVIRAHAARRPQPVPVFRADHPFLLLIRDTRTGSILFMGRLRAP
jgi:serpin B